VASAGNGLPSPSPPASKHSALRGLVYVCRGRCGLCRADNCCCNCDGAVIALSEQLSQPIAHSGKPLLFIRPGTSNSPLQTCIDQFEINTATGCAVLGPQLTNIVVLAPSPHSSGRDFAPCSSMGTLQLSTRCSSLAFTPSRSFAVQFAAAVATSREAAGGICFVRAKNGFDYVSWGTHCGR
jgi:hypothetical protein